MKVLFFGGGKMGELARAVLEGIDGIEVIDGVNYFHIVETDGRRRLLSRDEIQYDLVFSASYPGRIEQDVCKAAALGAVNMHTGLLPEGRGWHPINWAIIWGRPSTGITIHKIVDSYDAGDICLQHEVPIFPTDDVRKLRERIDMLVPQVITAFMDNPKFFLDMATKQNQAHVTYAPKRRPEDSELNLEASAIEQYNLWRSCDPDEYPCFIWRHGIKYLVVNGRIDDGIFTYELII